MSPEPQSERPRDSGRRARISPRFHDNFRAVSTAQRSAIPDGALTATTTSAIEDGYRQFYNVMTVDWLEQVDG